MNSKEAAELITKVCSFGKHSSVVFFLSPVTNEVEERHIYADQYPEVVFWAEHITSNYDKQNISYAAYLNGHLWFDKGILWSLK